MQVRISINATYYLAARAIAPGEVLTSADLIARDGDLTAMPQAIVTDPTQAVGAVALSRVPAGLPLRTDMLRGAASVSIGQNVHVVADGSGFSISAEGSAMNNAAPGQQVRVKTSAGTDHHRHREGQPDGGNPALSAARTPPNCAAPRTCCNLLQLP